MRKGHRTKKYAKISVDLSNRVNSIMQAWPFFLCVTAWFSWCVCVCVIRGVCVCVPVGVKLSVEWNGLNIELIEVGNLPFWLIEFG